MSATLEDGTKRGDLGVHLGLMLLPLLWGLNYPGTKIVLEHWSASGFLALRFVVIVPILVIWARSSGGMRGIARGDRLPLLAAGVLGIGFSQMCFVFAIQNTTVFATSLLTSMFPIFTLMAAALIGYERPRLRRWAGVALALLGIAVFEGLLAGKAAFKSGDLWALLASITFVAYTIVVRRLGARYSGHELLGLTSAIGAVILLPLGLNDLVHQDISVLSTQDWLVLGYVCLIPLILGYALLNWGIARIGAGPASMYALGVPIIGGISSAVVFGSPIHLYEYIGAAICLAGMALVQVSVDRPRPSVIPGSG
jgi:O-acetylserine/cysteine efflux transporter